MNSTTTLYLKHKTTGALEIVTFTGSTGNVHPDLFKPLAAGVQCARRRMMMPALDLANWTVQHTTTVDSDLPASLQPQQAAEGSNCT